jgi:hypothetical protein
MASEPTGSFDASPRTPACPCLSPHGELRGAALSAFELGEPDPKTKWLEQAIQRCLRGVVPLVNGAQEIRTRHVDACSKLLHPGGSDDLAEGLLKRHAVLDGRRQKLARERGVPQVLCQGFAPIFATPCHSLILSLAISLETGGLSRSVGVLLPAQYHSGPQA